MSDVLQNPKYGPKALEQQWLNSIWTNHDLICGCDDPTLHLLILINKKGNAPKPTLDVKNIKCLLTGDPTKEDTTYGDDVPFGEGELEKLFSEDGDDPDTAGSAG